MKSRDTLIRLKRFQAEEKRRRVLQLQTMIAEFSRITGDLDREIATEEQRANISDPLHFAYPTYARAARARRDNLAQSLAGLRAQLEDAEAQFQEASQELAKVQQQSERLMEVTPERRSAGLGEALRRA